VALYFNNTAPLDNFNELYRLYRRLHDAFGGSSNETGLRHVMKDLIQLKQKTSASKSPLTKNRAGNVPGHSRLEGSQPISRRNLKARYRITATTVPRRKPITARL